MAESTESELARAKTSVVSERSRMPWAPNQCLAFEAAAVCRRHRDPVPVVPKAQRLERDEWIASASVEQNVMEVEAVDDDGGIFEAGAKRGACWHPS